MIEYCKSSDDEWVVRYNGEVAGTFRYYDVPDFKYKGEVQFVRYLAYIRLEPKFRRLGILLYIVKMFDIKSLMVDDIDDIPLDVLIRIYGRLGFRLVDGSERFMIRD